jgi:prepilin-type N-terminal cleavage/methylation domain-containing protein
MRTLQFHPSAGYSLIELVLVVSVMATLAGIAVPVANTVIDDIHAAGAARHMAARVAAIRIEAVRRSSAVALRFESQGSDYAFTSYIDGNGNGVRTADITSGTDKPASRREQLKDFFANVSFGLLDGIPDIDGATGNTDGVRIGSSSLLSVAPNGSCTSGTLYVHGRRTQYAVRILGATGRARFYRYDQGGRRWISR